MKHLSSIVLILSFLPTCARTIVSEGDSEQDTTAVIIVEKTAALDGRLHFQSIQDAVNHASPGDTILIKEGTYHETVTVRTPGITIAAFDPCHPPVIDGADQTFVRPSWEHVQGNVYRTSYAWYKPQLTRREFNRYGGGTSADRIAMQVYEDGVLLRGYVGAFVDYGTSGYGAPYSSISQLDPMSPMFSPGSWYKREIRIPGRFMYAEQDATLYVWSAVEDHPGNHVYSIPVLENLVVLDAYAVTLRNLVLASAAGYAVVVADGANGARIEDCFFINDMYAIYVKYADNVVITDNFIQQKGVWERYWYYDCKESVLWAHAIALDHYPDDTASRHTEIGHNVIHGYYAAILANGTVTIHDNILSHCMSTHVNIESDCPEIHIYRNICHHVDESSIGAPGSRGPIWVFRNLFYHCGSMNKAGADAPDTAGQICYFYHNTLALGDLISHHPYDYPIFKRHIYRNNIFHLEYLDPGSELYWRYAEKDPSLGWRFLPFENGPDANYDLYWIGPAGPTRYIAYFSYVGNVAGGYLYYDFPRMTQETGLDREGLQADPMFLKEPQLDEKPGTPLYDTLSVMDYRDVIKAGLPHLLEAQFQRFSDAFAVGRGSPAVDRGTRLPPGWADVVQVLDGKPDIGAWEIDATGVPRWGSR